MNHYVVKFISYLDTERNYSEHTIRSYKTDLKEFFACIERKPSETQKEKEAVKK